MPGLKKCGMYVVSLLLSVAWTYFRRAAAVVNFITSAVAVSIFPKTTFLDRKSYVLRHEYEGGQPPESQSWMEKYRERGFEVIGDGALIDDVDCLLGKRYGGDRRSWIIPLDDIVEDGERINMPFEVVRSRSRGQKGCIKVIQ
ncbi:hypothetical protein CVT26_010998 [Gymnopilus dilepis]|uniref:Uncharacterized protein n=1 Tax=Gymnopilus dilepis TaxID=231916 RepID=A0A409VYB0_9AGAR|nr:hypothetical protein CVT26_010998 [Gymnopilus dilepis]